MGTSGRSVNRSSKSGRASGGRQKAPARIRRTGCPTIDFHAHMIVPEVKDFISRHSVAGGVGKQRRVSKSSSAFQKRQERENWSKNTDLKVRLKDMDRMGIDIQVLTPNLHHYCYWAKPEDGLKISRIVNDHISEIVNDHSNRFVGMGTIPLQDVGTAIKELDRAVNELDLRGVIINSNVNKQELGEPMFRRFWARAETLGVTVYIHPAGFTQPERLQKYFLWNSVAQPLEETLAMCSLIYEGVLDAFPRLRICIAHGGGYLPFYTGRVDRAYETRPETRKNIHKYPSQYLRNFFYDTVVYNRDMLMFLLKKVGDNRIVLGTDYPAFLGEEDPVGFVNRARGISRETKEKILWRNAAKLLKIRL